MIYNVLENTVDEIDTGFLGVSFFSDNNQLIYSKYS